MVGSHSYKAEANHQPQPLAFGRKRPSEPLDDNLNYLALTLRLATSHKRTPGNAADSQGSFQSLKHLFRFWLSRGQALFPLVVRQLAEIRPVGAHSEQIRVRLIAVRQHPFVLPSHSAAGKDVPFSVSRPRSMRIVTPVVSETLNPRAVGPDRIDFEVAVAKTGKRNQVPFWRPAGKIVITGGELRDLSVLDDLQSAGPVPTPLRGRRGAFHRETSSGTRHYPCRR